MVKESVGRARVMYRVVLTGTLCVATTLGMPAGGREKSASAAKVLAGRTIISGSKTAATQVRLPRRVRIPRPRGGWDGPFPDIALSGKGRIVGFYLTRRKVADFNLPYLLSYRVRFCAKRGCRSQRSYQFVYGKQGGPPDESGDSHGDILLPAGNYLLYLIADGSPATIRLRLHGLAGTTSIRPSSPVDSGFSLPTPNNSTTVPGGNAFWYGHEANFQGKAGIFIGVLRMRVENWARLRWGDCLYEPAIPPPPAPLAYSPECPGGISTSVARNFVPPINRELKYPFLVLVGLGGRWGWGQFFEGVFTKAEYQTISFHLDLDPTAVR